MSTGRGPFGEASFASFFTSDFETSLDTELENSLFVNATVPEPGTLLLLGAGLTGLAVTGRRRCRPRVE